MQQINDFINSITAEIVLDIVIANVIIIIFRILSGPISYLIVKLFKIKEKNPKEIKESAFYSPIKIFITILGIYVAFLFLKQPLQISSEITQLITVVFKVISVIAFSIGLAKSFVLDSMLIKKMREKSKRDLEDSSLNFILKIIRVVIYIVAVIIVLAILGVNLSGVIAGLGLGGVIVTLAAQDTAKNLFGGFVIFIDKPFAVGDWIQIDSYEGTVEDITFRSTRIRTFENSVLNIPNSKISDSSVINWSKMESRRYRFTLTLALDTPLERLQSAQEKISKMLKKYDAILDDSIIVKFDTISENGINLLICSYTDSVDYNSYLEEKEKINYKIMQILKEERIELAYDVKRVLIK